jgi:acetyl-CoA carboxylase biotin carboxyl carrier protein
MEYEQIKRLMDDMGNSKLTAIDIEFSDGIKISMKKEINQSYNVTVAEPVQKVVNEVKSIAEDALKKEDNYKVIKSPMVGTFYSKSSPTAKPFVEIGSIVKKGDVLCIVEAMKLMNEIESEFDGKIAEVCVKDEEAVDFGKPLFKII